MDVRNFFNAQRSPSVLIAVIVLFLATAAQADIVNGGNTVLDQEGLIYIPLTPATSGVLGDGGTVGLIPDNVTLDPGAATTGSVSFEVSFYVGDQMEYGEWVGLGSVLSLDLSDVDFKTQNIGPSLLYTETLSMTFLDPEDTAHGGITLNEANYGNYCGGFFETNEQALTYEIELGSGFGMTEDDAKAVSQYQDEVRLLCTFSATLTNVGTRRQSVKNTSEDLITSMNIQVAPEPATLALLMVGGSVLTLRRKRK